MRISKTKHLSFEFGKFHDFESLSEEGKKEIIISYLEDFRKKIQESEKVEYFVHGKFSTTISFESIWEIKLHTKAKE